MSKYKTYSKYNDILEKKFKGYSLKSLVKTHRNPSQFVQVKFLEAFIKKHPYDSDQIIDINSINNKTKNFLNSFKKKKTKKIVIDSWGRKSSYTKLYEPQPDPFRYHPNYNSIFKNVPCCRIAPLKVQIVKPKNKSKPNNNNKKTKKTHFSQTVKKGKNRFILDHKIFGELLMDNNNKENNKTLEVKDSDRVSKTLPAVKKHKKHSRNDFDKNNHAFKFINYMPRKDFIPERNDIISYIEPHDYSNIDKKTVIDFGKMENRDKKSVLINYPSLSVPSASYYNPKYELTDQRPTEILFTHQNIIDENKRSNRYLIRKLWTSYNVRLQYQLVDNNKLDKNVK
jgi:hypothetical protein